MNDLLFDIQEGERSLKYNKEQLKKVVDKIKEERSERWYRKSHTDDFRHAICLLHGYYYKQYDDKVASDLYMYPAKDWHHDKVYLNYHNILKEVGGRRYGDTSKVNVGFVCYKKDLFGATQGLIEDMWKNAVNKDRVVCSLAEYKDAYKKDNDKLYTDLEKFCDGDIVTVNHTGIKNVVVYIEQS